MILRLLMRPIWWLGVVTAIAFGALWGALPVAVTWFDPIDVDDHLVSAGGYTASAVVLLLAATSLEAFRGPGMARRLALLFAALYTFLALRAGIVLNDFDTTLTTGGGYLWDGVLGVLATPTTWLFLVTGVLGWTRIVRENRALRPINLLPRATYDDDGSPDLPSAA